MTSEEERKHEIRISANAHRRRLMENPKHKRPVFFMVILDLSKKRGNRVKTKIL